MAKFRLPVVGGLVRVIGAPSTANATEAITNLQAAVTALNAAVQTLQTPVVTPGSFSQPPTGTVKVTATKGVSPAFMASDSAPRADPSILVQRGRRGDEGDIGPRGYSGLAGKAGVAGAAGAAGVMGRRGDAGDTGRSGYTGATGPSGPQGVPGVAVVRQGEPGDVGRTGVPGPQGLAGTAGPPGAMGPLGGAAGRRMDHDQVSERAPRPTIFRNAPTAKIGLTVVNGATGQFMDAGSAPPLDVSIAPTMTGQWTFTPSASTTGPVFKPKSTTSYDLTLNSLASGIAAAQFQTNSVLSGVIGVAGASAQIAADTATGDLVLLSSAGTVRLNAGSLAISNLVAAVGGGVVINGISTGSTVALDVETASYPGSYLQTVRVADGTSIFNVFLHTGSEPAVLIGTQSNDSLGFITNDQLAAPGIILQTNNSVTMPAYGAGVATFDGSGNITSVAGGGKPGPPGRRGEDGDTGRGGYVGAAGAAGVAGAAGSLGATGRPGREGQQGDDGRRGGFGATGATGLTGAQGVPGVSWRVQFHDEPHMIGRSRVFDPRNIDGPVVINGSTLGYTLTVTGATGGSGAFLFQDGGTNIYGQFNSTAAAGGYLRFQRSGVGKWLIGDASLLDIGTIDDLALYSVAAIGLDTGGGNRRVTVSSTGNVTIAEPAAGVPLTITGGGTFATAAIQLHADDAHIDFYASGGGTDAKHAMIRAVSTSFVLSFLNDALNANTNPLVITRSGYAAAAVNWTCTSTSYSYLGTGALQSVGGAISNVSDERAKTDIRPFPHGLKAVLALNPILHGYTKESGIPQYRNDHPGFSAQNVQSVIPEAVEAGPTGMLGLSDRGILAALVNAVKELASRG